MLKLGEPIGVGTEKTIYPDLENDGRVVAEYNRYFAPETREQTKGLYYLQKLKHLLFPKNFPDIHAARHGEKVLLILDKVTTDEWHKVVAKMALSARKNINWQLSSSDYEVYFGFQKKIESDPRKCELEDAAKASGLDLDPAFFNYTYDPSGNLVNLDVIWPWAESEEEIILYYDPKKLSLAIENMTDGREKRLAQAYFSRLEKLFSVRNPIFTVKGQERIKRFNYLLR